MRHLDILLPFGLLPALLEIDLLRELSLPALTQLITSAKKKQQLYEDFARALPHETWLATQFALTALTPGQDNSPALACATMRELGLPVPDGTWFILHPAHIHIARDHLVLTDIRQIDLSAIDARLLFEVSAPLVAEQGKLLVYGNAHTWFIRADDWQSLHTSTPDAACGHNIDIWMPKGNGEQAWRKIHNEIQMQWFAHPLNQQREQQGKPSINSLWLWGGARATPLIPTQYAAFNFPNAFNGLYQYTQAAHRNASIADIICTPSQQGVLVLDQLLQPSLLGEWASWLEQFHILENTYFVPLLDALRTHQLDSLGFILTDHIQIRQLHTNRLSLKKFWCKPTLNNLLA